MIEFIAENMFFAFVLSFIFNIILLGSLIIVTMVLVQIRTEDDDNYLYDLLEQNRKSNKELKRKLHVHRAMLPPYDGQEEFFRKFRKKIPTQTFIKNRATYEDIWENGYQNGIRKVEE